MKKGVWMIAREESWYDGADGSVSESGLRALSPDLGTGLFSDVISLAHHETENVLNGFEPRSGRGMVFYTLVTGLLRERLQGAGWRVEEPDGVASVVAPTGYPRIACTTGDASTGRMGDGPSIHGKGRGTLVVSGQMIIPGLAVASAHSDGSLWYLVTYFDAMSTEIRAELSLPIFGERSEHLGWRRRIILPSVSSTPSPVVVPPASPVPVIDVHPRAVGD